MKYLFFITLLLTIISCKEGKNHNKVIEGTLYIKLIDVNNILYGLSDEDIEKFKNGIYNNGDDGGIVADRKFIEYHKILIDNNIVKEPHFKLKIKDGKIINVYTNEVEYKKLSKHLDNFDREKEKIIIKFEGTKISDGVEDPDNIFNQPIYTAKNIVSVNVQKGQTDWDK
ncbi:hypothetical protein MHTCC0001_17790 [Flavobacteriaceae bacterium MHTCC 0001]